MQLSDTVMSQGGNLKNFTLSLPNFLDFGLATELLPALQRVSTLVLAMMMDSRALAMLKDLPNLRNLEITCRDHGWSSGQPFLPNTISGFDALTSFSLVLNQDVECVSLMHAFTDPLRLQTFKLTTIHTQVFTAVVEALPSFCTKDSLRSLSMSSGRISAHPNTSPFPQLERLVDDHDLQSLFQFPNISQLHLNSERSHRFWSGISDKELVEIGKAWPRMEDLRMPSTDRRKPHVTHLGFSKVIASCPQLRTLHIGIDASSGNLKTPTAFPRRNNVLSQVVLDASSTISDPDEFAHFVARSAPNLVSFKFAAVGTPRSDLCGIERLVKQQLQESNP
jgi:hypothetical protein